MAIPAPLACPVTIAVILPVLNEAERLAPALAALTREQRVDEIIVVDGGSTDASVEIVCKFLSGTVPDRHAVPVLIQSVGGRAQQMHAGAEAARSDVLLFLHADCALPPGAADDVRDAVAHGRLWGRFDVRLSGKHFLLRVVERLMNWRSRLTGIATGDQGLFVRRDVYRKLGGYASLPLMEDIEFSARLKWIGRPACLPGPVLVSSRRWERHGILRTILLMWTLRLLYWLGVAPERLARWYYRAPSGTK